MCALLKALPENLCQPGGKRSGRTVVEMVARIGRVTRFSRVRDQPAELGRTGQGEDLVPVSGGRQGPADRIDLHGAVDGRALVESADQHAVAVGALIQHLGPGTRSRLHDHGTPEWLPGVVGLLQKEIEKSPQEAAGAELQDGFGRRLGHNRNSASGHGSKHGHWRHSRGRGGRQAMGAGSVL